MTLSDDTFNTAPKGDGASLDDTLSIESEPIIYTTDEEGKNHAFQMVDMIEVDSQPYALLLYLGEGDENSEFKDDEEDQEMVVMRILEEDGDQVFEMIEDDAEYEKVLAYLESEEVEGEDDEEEGDLPLSLN